MFARRPRENVPATVKSYLVSLLSVGLAFGVTLTLEVYLRNTPSLPFVLAVIFSTLFCGLGPGVVSSVLSVLVISYFFLPPLHSVRVDSIADSIQVIIFCIVAISVNALNLARQRAEEARRRLLQHRLDAAEAEATVLRSLLPICAWCKRIRQEDRWTEIENYARQKFSTDFTHTICPDCSRKMRAPPA